VTTPIITFSFFTLVELFLGEGEDEEPDPEEEIDGADE